MKLTVEQALAVPPLDRANVIAGRKGLTRQIHSIDVMEVPDIIDWVQEGQLLLSTAYAFRNDRQALVELIPELATRGAAGLALKTGRYIDHVPAKVLELADSLNFPVIELPGEVHYIDIMNPLIGMILDKQAAFLSKSQTIYQKFSQLVLSGGSLDDIVAYLCELLSARAVIIGTERQLLTSVGQHNMTVLAQLIQLTLSLREDLSSEGNTYNSEPERFASGTIEIESPEGGLHSTEVIASSVRIRNKYYGMLLVWNIGAHLNELDLLAIEHATTASALKIMQSRAIELVEPEPLILFLNDLVSGRVPSQEMVISRGRGLNWDPNVPYKVAAFRIQTSPGETSKRSHSWRSEDVFPDRIILYAALSVVQDILPGIKSWVANGEIIALISPEFLELIEQKDERQLLDDLLSNSIRERLEKEFGALQVWAGVGQEKENQSNLRQSYREARMALSVAQQLKPEGGALDFEQLGIYRILCDLPERESPSMFVKSEIGPLLAHDQDYNTDLVKTLDAFLRYGMNLTASARKMHIHPNTLRYRLDQIEELVGPFRDLPEKRLSFEVALRLLVLPESKDQ